jgi:hypothetical protein
MAEQEKAPRTIVSQGKNYKIYSDGTILIADVRASYPHLDKKWCKNPAKDTPAYSLTGILPNDTHEEARKAVKQFADDMLAERKMGKIKADAYFVRDGDLAGKTEYEESWIVAARETDNRPVVLNPDRSEMDQEDIKPTIKAGYRVDMLIEPWAQDNEHGKRINASLRAVRFRREDTPISEGGISKDEAISSFDDDEDGGFGGDDDDNGGL